MIEPSVREQTDVEDCEVCCRPIRIRIGTSGAPVVSLDAGPAE